MPPPLGAHLDVDDPIAAAVALGATAAQFFLGDPQGWKGPTVRGPPAAAVRAAAEAAGVQVWIHAPYVVNVASTNNRIRIPSRKLLQQTVDAAAEVGAAGVIVHGGHLPAGTDPQAGFENWFKAVDRLTAACPILVENTAGGANAMARTLDRIADLWAAIGAAAGGSGVGFCLDTCHANAAGIDLATVVEKVRAVTGRIDLVHANDSRDAFGSGADRHANLGHGTIDPELIATVVRAAGCAAIVETPAEGHAADLRFLRDRLG